MHELFRVRSSGERKVIQFNAKGQPIGDNAKKMQSYIGSCARKYIPITFEDWRHVPCELKDKIYETIKVIKK